MLKKMKKQEENAGKFWQYFKKEQKFNQHVK